MAHFHRLIFCALVALSVLLPASAFATLTKSLQPDAPTVAASLAAKAAWKVANNSSVSDPTTKEFPAGSISDSTTVCGTNPANTPYTCVYNPPTGSFWRDKVVYTLQCPANSSGTTCTCNAGFVEQSGACVSSVVAAKAVCDSLNSAGIPLTTNSTAAGLNGCYQGFVVRATGAAFGVLNGVAGKGELYGPFSCSGSTCSGTGGSSGSAVDPPAGAQEPNASQCKTTEYWGSVNGVGMCVKAVNTSFGGNNNTAPTPAGSASAPTSGLGSTAPPGATSSSQQTDCTGGSCTTKTTYTNGSGAVVGEATESKDQKTFCQENPAASICAQSSVGGTPCGSVDACTGDAIQCAINAQSKATTCALTTAPVGDVNVSAFNTAAGQSQGDQTGAITSTVNLGPGSFDQTNFLGAAGGMDDVNVVVAGHAVTLPFSSLNVWLARLGVVLQGVTFLLCARIVARG